MTIHESVQDQLSDYLDGELTGNASAEVERHLAGCAECSRVLAELKQVIALAGSLPPQPPPRDLWNGISSELTPGRALAPRRRFSFTVPELAAASLLLATLSGGAVAVLMQRSTGGAARQEPAAPVAATLALENEPAQSAETADPAAAPDVVPAASFADAQFDAAVSDLERALERGRGRLDPETVLVVEENLSIIDRAITEARRALASDPSNGYLSGHLMEARRRKLDLLRRATALSESN
jgi:anti-sigma factor RsiW